MPWAAAAAVGTGACLSTALNLVWRGKEYYAKGASEESPFGGLQIWRRCSNWPPAMISPAKLA